MAQPRTTSSAKTKTRKAAPARRAKTSASKPVTGPAQGRKTPAPAQGRKTPAPAKPRTARKTPKTAPLRKSRAPQPKALEVSYSGRIFRSRLEARWAVFLDLLDVNWDYEPCFYEVSPAGAADPLFYLPDFYLPDHRLWLEVKGAPFMDAASMAKVTAAVGGPARIPLREAPYTPSDRLLLGGPFRPVKDGLRPVHTLVTAAEESQVSLASAVFDLDGGGTFLHRAGQPWDTVPATGIKAARRPTAARLTRLLEPDAVPGTVPDRIARAYDAAYRLTFDDTARCVATTSPAVAQLTAIRRSGRPLGLAA